MNTSIVLLFFYGEPCLIFFNGTVSFIMLRSSILALKSGVDGLLYFDYTAKYADYDVFKVFLLDTGIFSILGVTGR